jgi:hypothetical protein
MAGSLLPREFRFLKVLDQDSTFQLTPLKNIKYKQIVLGSHEHAIPFL